MLSPANINNYYQEIGLGGTDVVSDICKAVIEYCGFGLREIEKYCRLSKISLYKLIHNRTVWGFNEENAIQFSLCIIAPILIGLRMADVNLYNQFINGKNSEPLISIVGGRKTARGLCSTLLDYTEAFEPYPGEEKTLVQLSDKLHSVYMALFCDGIDSSWGETSIGHCTFSSRTKDITIRAASMLSEYADF